MKLTITPKFLCMCTILLVHFAELTNSQLDFGDRPRITPAPGRGSGAGGGSNAGGSPPRGGGSPPRGGGGGGPPRGGAGASPPRGGPGGSPPRSGGSPPRPGGGGNRPPPGPPPPGGGGSGPSPGPPRPGPGGGGQGPPIIEAGGASENGVDEAAGAEQGPEGDADAGGLLGRGRGRGLFGLGGRRGQQPPPPQSQPPQIIPQSICTLKVDPGFCNLIIGRWYYDHRYHRCLPFLYTGCGGNINNFISIRQCEQATSQCHALGYSPSPMLHGALTPGALNPINPLSHLAPGYILGG